MKKIVYLIGLSIVLVSCFNKQQANNTRSEDEISTNLILDSKTDNTTEEKESFSDIEKFKKFISIKWISLEGEVSCYESRTIEISKGYLLDYTGMEPIECEIKNTRLIDSKTLEIILEGDCNYGNTFKVEIIDLEKKLVKWSFYNNMSYNAKPYYVICEKEGSKEGINKPYHTDLYNVDKAILNLSDQWKGLYYYKSSQTGKEFILDTRNDEILLEVGGDQYGYIDQLKTVILKDTLGLYHHKNISGANYDDTRKYNFLKFYKSSDGKFYFEGKLPYLPEGAIEFEKVK
jgi:hypothetical protein